MGCQLQPAIALEITVNRTVVLAPGSNPDGLFDAFNRAKARVGNGGL